MYLVLGPNLEQNICNSIIIAISSFYIFVLYLFQADNYRLRDSLD